MPGNRITFVPIPQNVCCGFLDTFLSAIVKLESKTSLNISHKSIKISRKGDSFVIGEPLTQTIFQTVIVIQAYNLTSVFRTEHLSNLPGEPREKQPFLEMAAIFKNGGHLYSRVSIFAYLWIYFTDLHDLKFI